MWKYAVAVLSLVLFSGCACVEKISVAPELQAIDVQKMNAGTATVKIEYTLKDCCPISPEHKSLLTNIQASIKDETKKLLEIEGTDPTFETQLASFNKKMSSVNKSLDAMEKACESGATARNDDLWVELEDVLAELKSQ